MEFAMGPDPAPEQTRIRRLPAGYTEQLEGGIEGHVWPHHPDPNVRTPGIVDDCIGAVLGACAVDCTQITNGGMAAAGVNHHHGNPPPPGHG